TPTGSRAPCPAADRRRQGPTGSCLRPTRRPERPTPGPVGPTGPAPHPPPRREEGTHPMTHPLRIAVLSAWHVHAEEYGRAAIDHPDTELVAVWDDDAERGRELAGR